MTALSDNRFDHKTGMIEGDHLRHLAKTGICNMAERVNQSLMGSGRCLAADDFPGKVRALIEKSGQLSEHLNKCDAIPVAMAADYLKEQSRIAEEALPLLRDVLSKREDEAKQAVAQLRATLTGKGGAVSAAVVDAMLRNADAVAIAEREASLPAWRTAFGICRDTATAKTTPRWLAVLIAQHNAHTAGMAAG